MPASTRDAFSSLEALSPVDGRYRAATAPLRELLSEAGLIGERVRIESRWLLHLSVSVPQLAAAALAPAVLARAQQLAGEPDADAAAAVKAIEAPDRRSGSSPTALFVCATRAVARLASSESLANGARTRRTLASLWESTPPTPRWSFVMMVLPFRSDGSAPAGSVRQDMHQAPARARLVLGHARPAGA